MKRTLLIPVMILIATTNTTKTEAQINWENLDLKDIIGKVVNVKKGFAPKFFLGKISIPKVQKVGEILGFKKNNEVNKLFNTFKTGRNIYKVASYVGSALSIYGAVKQLGDTITKSDKTALLSGLTTIASGLIVKFLTKNASYKAVDIFNGIAKRKIKDIFSIRPATQNYGLGLYVKL